MTTASAAEERTNIVDVMKDFGGPNLSVPDLTETIRQVETVKTVKFAFHPWYPLANFGSDGFRFNIPYPLLNRLELIPLAVFQYARIIPKPPGHFAFLGTTLAEAVPSMSSQSTVKTEYQMPSVSMRESALKNGVSIKDRKYPIASSQVAAGEQLIEEIKGSIALAEEAALSPSDGILPRTRELLNITANNGAGGKAYLDNLDRWCMEQYPSFQMDTEVSRAQKAMQGAIEAGNQGGDNFKTGVMAILQQQQLGMQRQQKTLDLLAQSVVGQKEQKEPKEPKTAKTPTRQGTSAGE